MRSELAGMTVSEFTDLPNELAEDLKTLLEREILYGERAGSPPFIRDIKLFRKPPSAILNNDLISTKHLVELFYWVKDLYPEELQYAAIDEYWDELDLFRNSEMENQQEFRNYVKYLFLEPEYYDEDDAEGYDLAQRERILNDLLKFLEVPMFGFDPDYEVSLYCLTDDQNENTAFAPYVFVGHTGLLILLREWIL
ncbi:MAG: hypothetical protein ACK4QL_04365 [Pseudanabaenaceae cyanobacterium]